MGLSDNIKVGDRLEIKSKKDDLKTYISQVENTLNKAVYMLHVPVSGGHVIKLPVNEKYSFLFFTEQGMVRFDAQITKYVKKEGFNLMETKLVSTGERMQRREFFRFNCLLPMKFAKIDSEFDERKALNLDMREGVIKDLGGGGIRFVSNFELSSNDLIKCAILLHNDFLVVIGRVLRAESIVNPHYKYQYRVGFMSLLHDEQEKIIRYIFNEQRTLLKTPR